MFLAVSLDFGNFLFYFEGGSCFQLRVYIMFVIFLVCRAICPSSFAPCVIPALRVLSVKCSRIFN